MTTMYGNNPLRSRLLEMYGQSKQSADESKKSLQGIFGLVGNVLPWIGSYFGGPVGGGLGSLGKMFLNKQSKKL